MKSKYLIQLLFATALLNATIANAQNPIIQTKFTADPAPMVYNDTIFLYTGHDEDDAFGFIMKNWLLYTSTDMVNWTRPWCLENILIPAKNTKGVHDVFFVFKRKKRPFQFRLVKINK